jgi:hypothetical protein
MADESVVNLAEVGLGHRRLIGDVAQIYRTIQQGLGKPIQADLELNLTSDDAKAQIDRLVDEFEQLSRAIRGAKEQVSQLEGETEGAVKAIDTILPGAGKKLTEAMKKGLTETKQAARELVTELRRTQSGTSAGGVSVATLKADVEAIRAAQKTRSSAPGSGVNRKVATELIRLGKEYDEAVAKLQEVEEQISGLSGLASASDVAKLEKNARRIKRGLEELTEEIEAKTGQPIEQAIEEIAKTKTLLAQVASPNLATGLQARLERAKRDLERATQLEEQAFRGGNTDRAQLYRQVREESLGPRVNTLRRASDALARGDHDSLDTILAQLEGRAGGPVTNLGRTQRPFSQLLRNATALDASRTPLQNAEAQQAGVVQELERLRAFLERGAATGGTAHAGGGNVSVGQLRETLAQLLRGELSAGKALEVEIGADQAFLVQSIRNAVAAANHTGLKVLVDAEVQNAVVGATEAAAPGVARATSPEARNARRSARLQQLRDERNLRLSARENPEAVLESLGDASLLADYRQIKTARSSSDVDELRRGLTLAGSVNQRLTNAFGDENNPLELRTQLQALAQRFDADFFNPIKGALKAEEKEIARLIAQGRTEAEQARTRAAASALTDAVKTARTNPRSVFERLGDNELLGLHDRIAGAQTSQDAGRLRSNIRLGETVTTGLNLALLDPQLPEQLAAQIRTVLENYDKAFVTPLKARLADLTKASEKAKQDADRKAKKQADEDAKAAARQGREDESARKKAAADLEARQRKLKRDNAASQRRQLAEELDAAATAKRASREDILGQDPLGALTRRAPELAPHAEAMSRLFQPLGTGATVDQLRAVVEAASQARTAYQEAIKQLLESAKNDPVRHAELLGVQAGIDKRFATPVGNAVGRLRDQDMRKQARDLARQQASVSWRDYADQLTSGLDLFAANRPDLRKGSFRDPRADSAQAYAGYIKEVRDYEREIVNLQTSHTDDELKTASKRVEAAQQQLRIAEELLRVRLLAGKTVIGPDLEITPPDPGSQASGVQLLGRRRTMDASEASSLYREALRTVVGPEFDAIMKQRAAGGGEMLSFSKFTEQLFSGRGAEAKALQREFLGLQQASAGILNDEKAMTAELERQLGPLREIEKVHRQIEGDLGREIAKQEVQRRTSAAASGPAGFGNSFRNIAAAFGGFSVGMTAAMQIRGAVQQYMQFGQEVAGIQGVLGSKNRDDAEIIAQGAANTAAKYGQNLIETARAARILAQSGLDAREVVKELDFTMQASKGMGMTVEQTQELQLAIRAITQDSDQYNQKLSYTAAVLEKISRVEAAYAVEAHDLSDAIKLTSPVLEQFSKDMTGLNDVFDLTIGLTTVVVERLRITGNQAGNALKEMFSRLTRPEILKKLQETYGAQLGTANGKDLLPADQLIASLGRRYAELSKSNPLQAKEFATQLSGGRRSNVVIALLQDYARVQAIATEASLSWGSVQERAGIATETMATTIGRLSANFQILIRNMLDASYAGQGVKASLSAVASVVGTANQQGFGGFEATALAVGGFAGAQGLKKLFTTIKAARTASSVAGAAGATEAVGGFTAALGALARFLGPTGVIITGGLLAASAIGALVSAFDRGAKSAERYRTSVKSLEELKVWDAPQLDRLTSAAQGLGYNVIQAGSERPDLAQLKRAYQDTVNGVMGTGGGEAGAQMRALWGELHDQIKGFDRDTEVALAKWSTQHPEKLREFQRRFADIFVRSLPEQARTAFSSITDEGTRVSRVAELVGGAAFAANVQIANAIEQVRAATNRMVTDAISGMAKIDVQARTGIWAKTRGAIGDAIAGRYNTDTPIPIPKVGGKTEAEFRASLQARDNLSTDLLEQMAKFDKSFEGLSTNTIARGRVSAILANPANAGRTLSFGALAARIAQTAGDENDPLFNLTLANRLQATRPDLSGKLRAAVEGRQLTNGERLGEALQATGDAQANRVAQMIKEDLLKGLPEAGPTRTANQLLTLLSGLGGGKADGTGTKTGEALAKFNHALLDLVTTIYTQIRRLRVDEGFAQRYGTGFDRPQALMQVARSLFDEQQSFRDKQILEIIQGRTNLQNIDVYATKDAKGNRIPKGQQAETKLRLDLSKQQDVLKAFTNASLPQILGNSPEAREVIANLKADLAHMVDPATAGFEELLQLAGTLDQFLDRMADGFARTSRAEQATALARATAMEIEQTVVERRNQLEEAELGIFATALDKLEQRRKASEATYAVQQKALVLRALEGKEDALQIANEARKLQAMHEVTQAYDEQLALAEARRAVDEQGVENLRGMLSGVKQLVANGDAFRAILYPQGGSEEERAFNRYQARLQLVAQTVRPIFGTIFDRVFDNAVDNLVKKLFSLGKIQELVTSPEEKLKENLSGAQFAAATSESLSTSGATAASAMGDAVLQSGLQVAQMWQAVLNGQQLSGGAGQLFAPGVANPFRPAPVTVLGGGAIDGVGTSGTLGAVALSPDAKRAWDQVHQQNAEVARVALAADAQKQQLNSMLTGLGLTLGTIGGNLVGKGGQGAQLGSGLGSTGGALLGNFLLPGVGGLAGGALGGVLGGLFGKLFDKKEPEKLDPQVRSLEAIERAQRETITAIQQQTDALLRPENRFLNLPATFSVPSMAGALMAGGGTSVSVTIPLEVNVNPGASANDVRAASSELRTLIRREAQAAVEGAFSNDRRNRSIN